MDKGTARWRNTPIPSRGVQISMLGRVFDLHPNGRLAIDILNIGLNTPPPPPPPLTITEGDSPQKRQKMMARVPPRTFPSSPAGEKVEQNQRPRSPYVVRSVIPTLHLNPHHRSPPPQHCRMNSASTNPTALSNPLTTEVDRRHAPKVNKKRSSGSYDKYEKCTIVGRL